MSQVDVKEASRRLEELVEQAARGEEIIIPRNERPVARLSAAERTPKRQFGSAGGKIWKSDDFDEPLEDFSIPFEHDGDAD